MMMKDFSEPQHESKAQQKILDNFNAHAIAWGGHENDPHDHSDALYSIPYVQEVLRWYQKRCDGTTGTIVELGCAEGYILDNVGAPSAHRIGIDFNPGRIGRGRKKRPHIEFIEANFVAMDFPLADVILMPGCLEHIPFDAVRAQIDKAIAASRGAVLFDLPWWDGRVETFGSGIHLNPAHAWVCTPTRLDHLMSGIDYEATLTSEQECIMIEMCKGSN